MNYAGQARVVQHMITPGKRQARPFMVALRLFCQIFSIAFTFFKAITIIITIIISYTFQHKC